MNLAERMGINVEDFSAKLARYGLGPGGLGFRGEIARRMVSDLVRRTGETDVLTMQEAAYLFVVASDALISQGITAEQLEELQ